MFFIISKILKIFILPLTWIFLLLILAYFIKKKKWKRGFFISAIVLLLVFTDKPLLQWAQYMSTRQYSHQQLPKKHYEVAIVMGGYSDGFDTATMQPIFIEDRGERLWEAIRLYESGVTEKIMITGDATISKSHDSTGTEKYFKIYLSDFGIHDSDLILEHYARNTRENATYSIAILDSLGYTPEQCLIVTSASHMKRSIACFEAESWTLDGYATNIYPKPHPKLYQFLPQWKPLTDWKELLNEWFGRIIYKIVGY
ncbi:MAG: YdcF family protein [Bacteroidales bacterium]|nr:YdcF family protein [Bacteroidales bacterium]